MRISEGNDHFVLCHSATSRIIASFIRAYLTRKKGFQANMKDNKQERKMKDEYYTIACFLSC